MYSPEPMNDGREAEIGRLEERLAELNARIEAGLTEAEGEARELGDLLEKVDFGPFDAALEELERPSGGPGGD